MSRRQASPISASGVVYTRGRYLTPERLKLPTDWSTSAIPIPDVSQAYAALTTSADRGAVRDLSQLKR